MPLKRTIKRLVRSTRKPKTAPRRATKKKTITTPKKRIAGAVGASRAAQNIATFGSKTTFADRSLKALYKGAATTAAKAKRLAALQKTGSVSKALASTKGAVAAKSLIGLGATAGAGLVGAAAIGKAAKKTKKTQNETQKRIVRQAKESREAIQAQRKRKKKTFVGPRRKK